MLVVIVWWAWMQVIGLAALPLAYRFFRRLPGRGYAFARPLGLLLTTYVLWLGGSLGVLRNSLGGALFSIGAVAALSVFFYRRGLSEGDPGLLAWLKSHGRLVLAVELLFAGALALWALLRAYSPDLLTTGGEKFMEIMFLNSIGRSEYFPPHDAWLSGYAISYYYFGYVMMAMLTRLSGFAAHITFNVALASLFALTCTGAFGLVYDLVAGFLRTEESAGSNRSAASPVRWGLLGSVLVAVMGNLEGFLEVLYSARLLPVGFWRWLDIQDLNGPFPPGGTASWIPNRSGWWWWRASRVIHDLDPQGTSMGIQPIDEFPGFSFLLGDMHPHVLGLPFVLLALALALNVLLEGLARAGEPWEERGGWLGSIRRLPLLVPLCLGALGLLNTWDVPIYWLVFVAAYGLALWERRRRWDWELARDVGVTGLSAGILGILLYLPFYLGFQTQAGGVLPTLYVGTRFRQYFVMFGPFLVAIAGLLLALLGPLARDVAPRKWLGRWAGWLAAFLVLPTALMALVAAVLLLTPGGREMLEGIRRIPAVYEIVGESTWPTVLAQLAVVKLRTWVMPLAVALMASLGMILLQFSPGPSTERCGRQHASVRFVLILAVVGLLLTLSVEFVYLVDNFRVRMNTIFKFYFQAWVLMAIASAFAAFWLSRRKSWLRSMALGGFWLLFAMAMVYPVLGNIRRAEDFASAPRLDGTAYLKTTQPDDYAAIAWLNENVPVGGPAPVILEKPAKGGSSYVYEGRVSALTGLPTLLGWAGHEGQWRGSYEIQSSREPDIDALYGGFSVEEARALLEKYNVTYVYVGPLERSEYDPRALEKFAQFMDVIYQQGSVTIYQARR